MANEKCPYCGKPLQVDIELKKSNKKQPGWFGQLFRFEGNFESNQPRRRFGNAAAYVQPEERAIVPAHISREIGAHLPNLESHDAVPAQQAHRIALRRALAWGVIVAIGGGELWAWAFGPSLWAYGFSGVGVGLWVYNAIYEGEYRRRVENYDKLLFRRDEVTPVEQVQSLPEKEEIQLEIVHRADSGKPITTVRPTLTGITDEALALWAGQVSGGLADISESNWVGKNKPFTQTAYRGLLDTMAKNGVIRKDGKAANSKWVVTTGGKSALRAMARDAESRVRNTHAHSHTDDFEFVEE